MDIQLNDDYDLALIDNDLALTGSIDDVIQELKVRLQFYFKEWFLDETVGIPYFEAVFQKGVSVETINGIFINEINSTDNVNEILEYSSDFDNDNREFTISFKVDTTYGVTTITI